MDPHLLQSLAATLIRRYGDDLLQEGEDLGEALVDKGTDAVASAAPAGKCDQGRARRI
jgi:hypothetical protein